MQGWQVGLCFCSQSGWLAHPLIRILPPRAKGRGLHQLDLPLFLSMADPTHPFIRLRAVRGCGGDISASDDLCTTPCIAIGNIGTVHTRSCRRTSVTSIVSLSGMVVPSLFSHCDCLMLLFLPWVRAAELISYHIEPTHRCCPRSQALWSTLRDPAGGRLTEPHGQR
jgi:hypothetical protein